MTTRTPYLCVGCEHRFGGSDRCAAFPDQIPAEILAGFDHRKAFAGDNGIRFLSTGGNRVEKIYDTFQNIRSPK